MTEEAPYVVGSAGGTPNSTTLSAEFAIILGKSKLPPEAVACLAALATGEGGQSFPALPPKEGRSPGNDTVTHSFGPSQDRP